MKNTSLFLSTLLALSPFASPTANAMGGAGGHDPKHHAHQHHAHHAAPGAAHSAHTAGQQLGFQQNALGNYDAVNRVIINNTTERVLNKSEAIDTMLATDAIAPEGWMMLKSVMAESMENAAAQQETGQELPVEANGGEANGSGETGYVDSNPVPSTPNVAAAMPETDSELSTYSNSETSSSPGAVASASRNMNSDSSSAANSPTVFSGFALPISAGTSATGLMTSAAAEREIASVPATKNQAPAGAASGVAGHGSVASASDQRTLALAQALAGKRSGEAASDSAKSTPKKKSSFPDPIRAIFGKSKAKYAATKDTKSPLTKFTTEKSGMTVALPPQDAQPILAEEDEDDSNWTLLFLMAMGFFATAAALYVAWKRPRKSTIQLMVPSNGEHFTIRPATNAGEYILDIKDARGNLVRSAGMLRPQSVARAAVLPPSLAAQLGAEGSFDRFEFTAEGEFRPTEKEEGYQIFPFVLNA